MCVAMAHKVRSVLKIISVTISFLRITLVPSDLSFLKSFLFRVVGPSPGLELSNWTWFRFLRTWTLTSTLRT